MNQQRTGMKTYLECYPCFLKQTLRAVRMVREDEPLEKRLLESVMDLLINLPDGVAPPEIGHRVHALVREETGVDDPFREAKLKSTREALALYPDLRELVKESRDPLETAVRLSIAGNIIDLGVRETHADLEETVERVLSEPLEVNHLPALKERLVSVEELLYLADNAGETVFDRLLIDALPVPVTYVVKGGPILNDAVREDALAAGVDESAREIIDSGSRAPGTVLSLCSEEFRAQYRAAPLVIAKGQGNYETLSNAGGKVFCLLQVKCPVIGRDLGAPVGGLIVRQSGGQ